jgi:hypothetical protein
MGLDLGLPITDEQIEAAISDPKNLSDQKWKTLLALGLAKINAKKTVAGRKPASILILILRWTKCPIKNSARSMARLVTRS